MSARRKIVTRSIGNPDFIEGYVCAVAEIIRLHGNVVIARDVLKSVGPIDYSTIDDFDRKAVNEAGLP